MNISNKPSEPKHWLLGGWYSHLGFFNNDHNLKISVKYPLAAF
jgi:hypothetical protein